MIMDNKYKHMDYIQSTITRMGSNSFYLKGWTITIVAAIVALSIKESDWKIYACALFLTIMFWFLDSYYLKQEKLFRELYKKVSSETDDGRIDFSMDTSPYKNNVSNIPSIMFWNISVTPLYLSISVVLIILIHVI
mgnify:CR=1 FL=1